MKNQKLKNYFKLRILIFGISLLLTNCQNQDVGIIEIEQDKYLVTRLNQNEFEKNIKLLSKLSSLNNKTKNSKVSSRLKENNSQLDLYLNEATYIEDLENDYHSYTFSIFNDEENFNIKNIVFSVLKNGDYEAFSVTYYLTEEQRKLVDQGLYINLDDKMSIEPFDMEQINILARGGGSGGCTVFVNYEVACSCHDDHSEPFCSHPNSITESYRIEGCDGGGGGIGGGNPSGGTDYGTPKGTVPPNTQPVVTSPIRPDGSNVAVTNLTRDLTLNSIQISWLNKNTNVAINLLSYLVKERYSVEAKNFAESAIDALFNNGEIDLTNMLIYNPQVAQDYKARMSPAEITIFNTLNTLQKEGYLRAATQAYIYAETHFTRPVRNTKGDTFKHTFWNALSTVYIGESLTEQLTTAHENINYNPNYPNHFKETQMDLFNNSKGRQIAYGSGRLYQLVQNALENGELRYLSNLEFTSGFWRATDNSQLIPTNQ